jgi:transcriptional regulator with XRE-family HTH domain
MSATGLGIALKMLRERRTLSQRELGELSEVDNAYISRLEVGEKVNPTPETITKLLRVLKAPERDASILKWLAVHPITSPDLVKYTLDTPDVLYDYFVSAAGMSFRGDARPTPEALLARVKRMYEEDEE